MTTHRQIFSDYKLSTTPHTLTIATDPPTTAIPEPTAALLSTGALALIAFAAIRRRMVTT